MKSAYILGGPDGHTPILCEDTVGWARWFEGARERRVVRRTERNGIRVSTVFLGLDHRFGLEQGPPILFETMVFKGESGNDEDCERYCTWADAEDGHWRMVQKWCPDPIEEAARMAKEGV